MLKTLLRIFGGKFGFGISIPLGSFYKEPQKKMAIKIKLGVVFKRITPEMIRVMEALTKIWEVNLLSEPTITSAADGKHMDTSLHFKDQALDIRINDIPTGQHAEILKNLKDALGLDYDVVLEKDHFHIEFQPKVA